MTKELSISATARLLGVSQKWVRVLIERKFLRPPLTEARVTSGFREYQRTKSRKRAKTRAPAELASLLADERARSLELQTGLLDRTLLASAQVASDLDKLIAALRNGMYTTVANLPLDEKRAGEDAADALMARIASEAGRILVGLGGELPPADPTDEERAALLDAQFVPEPAGLPEPAVLLTGKAREARSRLLYRRTRNNAIEATTLPRSWAETMLREYAGEAVKELSVADLGAPLTGVIEALDALADQIIAEWRNGIQDEGDDSDGDEE